MKIITTNRTLKILDFDCEARPLSWIGQDYVTKEPTAIAWKFIGSKGKPIVLALGEGRTSSIDMLTSFVEAYNEADMVTGHYIRGFDLPLINGALSDWNLPPLEAKLTSDTKLDLYKRHGMSNSQESIGAMLRIEHEKVTMTQGDWRNANRLTPEGIKLTKIRVSADVEQHIEMRAELLKRGWLGPPRAWDGIPSGTGRYHP
jgi:hypothetical protein